MFTRHNNFERLILYSEANSWIVFYGKKYQRIWEHDVGIILKSNNS